MAKGLIKFNENRCKGCELCISVCPVKIIKLNDSRINKKGYHPAGISDMDKCTGCASCALICPDGAIHVYRNEGGKR